jgi:hypothetical protein
MNERPHEIGRCAMAFFGIGPRGIESIETGVWFRSKSDCYLLEHKRCEFMNVGRQVVSIGFEIACDGL